MLLLHSTCHPQALSAAGEMFKLFNRDSAERVKWLDKGQEHPHRVALQVRVRTAVRLKGQAAGMGGCSAAFTVQCCSEMAQLSVLP